MISTIRSKLSALFEPVSSAYHGWRHFNDCVPDHKRPALAWRKTAIEAMAIQGGLCLGAGLSGLHPSETEALVKTGILVLIPSVPLAGFMAVTVRDYARAEISRMQRLDEFRR